MRYLWILVFILIASTSSAQSGQFCFASAETYYEQVYCQLQAKAQTKGLPGFHQFRKNTEAVQFALLKRPAERNAIKLPVPAKKINTHAQPISSPQISPQTIVEKPSVKESVAVEAPNIPERVNAEPNQRCQLVDKALYCNAQQFHLLGNKANHRLDRNSLSPENKMELPVYQGGDVNQYLSKSYQRYIAKMCAIGLGSVTMTYGKFTYLYRDINGKGLDFSQRFETMYSFLKKDKASMGVSESINLPPGLLASDCSQLGDMYYVCEKQGRNFIFARQ